MASTPASSTLPPPEQRSTGAWDAPSPNAEAPPTARILVVDDEPLARQMFTDVLLAHRFDVVAVGRGEEAFEHLGNVDLVLLDAMLPGRDGWSICQEIKADYDPLLPVIMVTARTAPDDVVRTFAAGADDYVAKPFHVAELKARIDSRLRVHRAERALQDANRQLRDMAEQNYLLYQRAHKDAEERSLLLREIDHRVRNNLSVIMGLVAMERNRNPARSTAAALVSLENRLRSFLLVHEALRRQNYRAVSMREVAERMMQRLRNSMEMNERVRIEVQGESASLDERQAFALALALNELISNALRHAFPEERGGTLRLKLGEDGGEAIVELRDDGTGVGEGAGPPALGSGRSIVEALIRGELGGRVSYDPASPGTAVRLSFPLRERPA